MKKVIFIFSLILALGGLQLYDITIRLYNNGFVYLYLFLYWLPFIGLTLMWVTLIMIKKDRIKADIRIKSVALPNDKPKLAWDPKYKLPIDHTAVNDSHLSKCIQSVMEAFNFKVKLNKNQTLFYERGSYFKFFSIKRTKLKIVIEKGTNGSLVLYTGYGNQTLDTGDLWRLTKEIANSLITTVSSGTAGGRGP